MRRLLGIICLLRGHGVEIAGYYTHAYVYGMEHFRCPRCHVPVFGGCASSWRGPDAPTLARGFTTRHFQYADPPPVADVLTKEILDDVLQELWDAGAQPPRR